MYRYFNQSHPPFFFFFVYTLILDYYSKEFIPIFQHNRFRRRCLCSHSLMSGEGRAESKRPRVIGAPVRSVAACWPVCRWGCPDPTGSHLLGCPLPRDCGGPRWCVTARPRSLRSRSSRLLFCRSSRVQTAGNCPQPAGIQLSENIPPGQMCINDQPAARRLFPFNTSDLVCSEEVWRFQHLAQLFQPSEIAPLKGKTRFLQERKEKLWVARETSANLTLTTMCVLDSTKLSNASVTWSLLLVLLKLVWHSPLDFCTGKNTDFSIIMQKLQLLDDENSVTWHDFLCPELCSLPGILRCGNPESTWSSASPSTACTWSSAPPAGLVPGLSGPLGPQPPSSRTCHDEAGAALGPPAAPPRGTCCEGEYCDWGV